MSEEKIKYGSISVIKCYRNVYLAKTTVENKHCRKMEVEMKGSSAEIAREKLELFLNNKPYSHLK